MQRASGWCKEVKQVFEYIPEHSHQTFSADDHHVPALYGARTLEGLNHMIGQESSRLLTETSTVIAIEYHGDQASFIVLDKGYCTGNSELRWYHGITAPVLISR